MARKNPEDFTVKELQCKLKERQLPVTITKNGIIARLNGADPTGKWMKDSPKNSNQDSTWGRKGETSMTAMRPNTDKCARVQTKSEFPDKTIAMRGAEIKIPRQEKDLARSKPASAPCEIEGLMEQLNIGQKNPPVKKEPRTRKRS